VPEEVEKNDTRGPRCFECSGYEHVRENCGNLKQAKGKAYNATLSDDSEEEKVMGKDQKFLNFIAPHEDPEESQSYYSESSDDGEELKESYKILYVKFLKLRETCQQHVLELNSLKIEKSTLLLKITYLEEKLLEAQLQLERITNEKITQMLSVQKCPSDKIGLEYVAFTSEIASTSKTVFIKPIVPEPLPTCVDKGKDIIGGEVIAVVETVKKSSTKKSPPTCHHCGITVTSDQVSTVASSEAEGQEGAAKESYIRN
jgi:hypothetical protein